MINIPPFEILPYKTLNDTNYNINYNLRNLETDLALTSKAKDYISPNVVLSIVVHCSGIIFLMRQKQNNGFPNLNANLPSAGSL